MNYNDITIGQAKEIAAMFGTQAVNVAAIPSQGIAAMFGTQAVNVAAIPSQGIAASMVGKYVIVRSRNEGLNAGLVEAADDTGVILKDAKRLWYHKPAVKTESWYEGVANHGLSKDSKVSGSVARKVIIEDYSMTECTEIARQSIETAVANAS